MQFLKTLLIVLVAGLAVAFAFNNWMAVPIRLWGGLVAEVNLPLLMVACFLIGVIPTWLWNRAIRWRLSQRLSVSERTVADLRAAAAPPPVPVSDAIEPQPLDSPAASAPPLIDEPQR